MKWFSFYIILLFFIQVAASKKYLLIVNNGRGSGTYEEGKRVKIECGKRPDGKRLGHWSIDKNKNKIRPEIGSVYRKKTTLVMPASNVVIEPEFVDRDMYEVRVHRGYPDDYYKPGVKVKLRGHKPPSRKRFDKWIAKDGDISVIKDVKARNTEFIMPKERIELKATWKK